MSSSDSFSIDSQHDIVIFLKALADHIRKNYNYIYGPQKLKDESYYLLFDPRNELELLYQDVDTNTKHKTSANNLHRLLQTVHTCPRCNCHYSIEDLISKTYGISKMCQCHPGVVNRTTQRWSCCNRTVGPANACVILSHYLGGVVKTNKLLVVQGSMQYMFFKTTISLIEIESNQNKQQDKNKMSITGTTLILPFLYWFYIASHGRRKVAERGSTSKSTEFITHLDFGLLSSKIDRIIYMKNPNELLARNTNEMMRRVPGYRDTNMNNERTQDDNTIEISGKKFAVRSSEVSSNKIIEYVVALDDEEEDEDTESLDMQTNLEEENDIQLEGANADKFQYNSTTIDLKNIMILLKAVQ